MRPILLALGAALLVALTATPAAPAAGAKTKHCPNPTIDDYVVRQFHASGISCQAAAKVLIQRVEGTKPNRTALSYTCPRDFSQVPHIHISCRSTKVKSRRFDAVYWHR